MNSRVFLIVMLAAGAGLLGEAPDDPSAGNLPTFRWTNEAMPRSLPNLIQIATYTKFFLDLSNQVEFSDVQREKLQEIYFDHEAWLIRYSADFQLAHSQLNALLSRSSVEMEAVEEMIQTKERLRSEVDVISIRHALEAIKLLNHQQHLRILSAVRDLVNSGQAAR